MGSQLDSTPGDFFANERPPATPPRISSSPMFPPATPPGASWRRRGKSARPAPSCLPQPNKHRPSQASFSLRGPDPKFIRCHSRHSRSLCMPLGPATQRQAGQPADKADSTPLCRCCEVKRPADRDLHIVSSLLEPPSPYIPLGTSRSPRTSLVVGHYRPPTLGIASP